MHVDDCADGLVYLMTRYSDSEHVNISTGKDVTIAELAHMIMASLGLVGGLIRDTSKPGGTPQKLMDNAKLKAMGWTPKITLEAGLKQTIAWYQAQNKPRGVL